MAESAVFDGLKCPICLDYANEAVETSCCKQIYCEACLTPLHEGEKPCPYCRVEYFDYTEAETIRRIFANLSLECSECKETTTRGNLKEHKEICSKREYKCVGEDCEFTGIDTDFLDHLQGKHRRHLLTSMSTIDKEECPITNCNHATGTSTEILQHIKNDHRNNLEIIIRCPFKCQFEHFQSNEELVAHIKESHAERIKILEMENDHLRSSRIKNSAGNGKFYCNAENQIYGTVEGKMKVQLSKPCNETTGLNCPACMKLDVMVRDLPYGHYVNKDGNVSTPKPCSHDLKDKGSYFKDRKMSRPIVCHHLDCGNRPVYYCGFRQNNKDCCSENNVCDACREVATVVDLVTTTKPKRKLDFYEPVWK